MKELRQLSSLLHDLCQPLTSLQCRLELAVLLDTPEAYGEVVEHGITECMRLAQSVRLMREITRVVVANTAENNSLKEPGDTVELMAVCP
jgi:signal transduction histidine kinase